MLFLSAVVCILTIVCGKLLAKKAPEFIHPCGEPTRECLLKATQYAIPEFVNGIPELGVEPLDPFTFDNLTLPLNGLKVTFRKGTVTGFRNSIIDDILRDQEKQYFEMEFHTSLTVKGRYTAVGKILVLPIDGSGDASITITNLKMRLLINTKYTKDKNGNNHIAIKNYKYNFTYGDNIVFDLQNIFKNSKELSDTVLKFMNENWKTVAEELGKPIVDYAVKLVMQTVEKFYAAVPYEELSP